MLSAVVKAFLRRRYPQVQHALLHPRRCQEDVFAQLVLQGKSTRWGQTHGYAHIRSYADYARQVPVHTYEAFFPYVEQVLRGEADVLWPGRTRWFAKSSGTTNDVSKFIPIPPICLQTNHYAAGKDMLAIYFHNYPQSRLAGGKVLSIGGSSQVSRYNENARYGDLSAVLIENMPRLYERGRAPGRRVALMDEWEAKLEAMARETLRQPITGIAGVPTWTLVLIDKLFQLAGTRNLHDIWPGLEVFFHGAVSFTPYREQFRQLIPHPGMHYLETYNASEGFFALQTEPAEYDMALLPHRGIFYEFIPMSELGSESARALPLWEVETGVNYAMVISTMGGLWRYQIGDTVQFTTSKPYYKLVITGRTRHFINAFGEEVVVGNTDMAVARACHLTGAQVAEYTAAPIFQDNQGKGGHEWVIEFARVPDNLGAFVSALDAELQTLNSDYAAKRYKDIALQLPRLHVVPPGTFHAWMKQRGKLGGQHKVPRLSNSREYVEALLGFA
ncbi:MAG: GH3 auxin-responsive promoter family protein [Bacteroidetes bacterium]|nr:GH3 auxin-responsive promoter family protein [Bacteroidota bacterium]